MLKMNKMYSRHHRGDLSLEDAVTRDIATESTDGMDEQCYWRRVAGHG